MITKHIVVLPYDEQWKQDFLKIKAELTDALGQLIIRIEHVGSTSVPGLSAKPIIDIDVVIKDYSLFENVVSALGKIGYQHEGDLGIKGREAFKYSGKEHLRKHHLYVCPEDSPELKRHMAFRDYLRTHPDAVWEYSRIKEEGAARYPDDIERYIAHKSPFIERIYAELGLSTFHADERDRIKLVPMTADMYHSFFSEYENDPDILLPGQEYVHYEYSEEKAANYIQRQRDMKRIPLAIMCGDEIVGEIVIKSIEPRQCATLSIVLKNAQYKDRGIGTQAVRLAIQYVFNELDIPTLYADTVRTNSRSQHVLEKAGFTLIREDEDFKYYRIDRT